ncbi:MAG: hypothetical protein QOC96_2357 [Acidobacteriota bacterium]|jgi:hypothetical protein|nr:hypothetical protein [Acidobacteriota bacterium]
MSEVVEKKSAEAVGQTAEAIIYDSPPSETDDDLWLAQGVKMLEESVPGVRNAASELIKALGLLQTVYLGILGFAKFIPENMEVYNKALFIVPIIPWVVATYYCLRVMKTDIVRINLRSPTDIREKATTLLEDKQSNLENAFILLIAGIVMAFVMVVFRLHV